MEAYFKYLIWMMLFVIIIEMVFPDSAYRKYIKLVLGCILVYTMLSPVVKLIRVDGRDYESYVRQYEKLLDQNHPAEQAYEQALRTQQESLEKMYEESIKNYVEQQFQVSVQEIAIKWEENVPAALCLTVGKKHENIGTWTIRIGDKSGSTEGDEKILKNKIKTCLSNFYNVQVDNIYITVQKN